MSIEKKKLKNIIFLSNIKGNNWLLAEDIPNINFNFCQIWLTAFANDLSRACGRNYKKVILVNQGFDIKFYFGKKDSAEFSKFVLNKIIKNPRFGEKINQEIRKGSDRLKKYSAKLRPEILSKLSNRELIKIYADLDKIHTDLYSWGWLPNVVDMFQNDFTVYLKKLLRKKLDENKINQALIALSIAKEKSIFQKDHESFLRLVALKEINSLKLTAAVNSHLKKYFYLKYLWLGKDGVYNFDYYVKEIDKFIKSGEQAAGLLKKEEKIFKETLEQRRKLIKKLKFSRKEIDIFNIYADFAVTKAYRRDAQIYWAYSSGFLLEEFAKRFNLPKKLIYFLVPAEINGLLQNKISAKILKQELSDRFKFMVYYTEKGGEQIITGNSAREIAKELDKEEKSDLKELSGQTACMGKARGRVKIVNSIMDMKKMEKGDILVSIATNPDIVAAMKKAAAIITEQGGITSHAAIVSRELRIPCIIGTRVATKALKDGDLVEVDANKGIVKILK